MLHNLCKWGALKQVPLVFDSKHDSMVSVPLNCLKAFKFRMLVSVSLLTKLCESLTLASVYVEPYDMSRKSVPGDKKEFLNFLVLTCPGHQVPDLSWFTLSCPNFVSLQLAQSRCFDLHQAILRLRYVCIPRANNTWSLLGALNVRTWADMIL